MLRAARVETDMGYALRHGVSFCDVGDRLVFLDIVTDRYFMLGEEAEAAFRAIRAGNCEFGPVHAALKRSNVLVETISNGVPEPCALARVPMASLLDEANVEPSVEERLRALLLLATARAQLRRKPLHVLLGGLANAKMRTGIPRPAQSLSAVSAAFEWTARMMRSHDQCLARSLSITRRAIDLGVSATLVIGVRLRPFAAHSWAQMDGGLINDRHDNVRTYTPILAI